MTLISQRITKRQSVNHEKSCWVDVVRPVVCELFMINETLPQRSEKMQNALVDMADSRYDLATNAVCYQVEDEVVHMSAT